MKRPIKLYWWRWRYPDETNFGDEITGPLLERLTGRRIEWAPATACDVLGAGSLLQRFAVLRGRNMPLVWGTGFIRPRGAGDPLVRDLRAAVRGRLSLAQLPSARADLRFGDPGLLANLFVERPVTKRYALGVIPHYWHFDDPFFVSLLGGGDPSVRHIDVRWSPETIARQIAECDAIVSSSLHGLIVSDAVGVPNLRIRPAKELHGGDFKFDDYYSAFPSRIGASARPDELRLLSPAQIVERVQHDYQATDGIETLRQGLIDIAQQLD